jgi:hypothetical protein
VLTSAVAAALTLAAVISAFVVQALQAKSDRKIHDDARRRLFENAAAAATNAADALIELDQTMDTQLLSLNSAVERSTIAWVLGIVDYYLGRDLPDVAIVGAMVSLRPLLAETLSDLDKWRLHSLSDPQGMPPETVRVRLRERVSDAGDAKKHVEEACAAAGV